LVTKGFFLGRFLSRTNAEWGKPVNFRLAPFFAGHNKPVA